MELTFKEFDLNTQIEQHRELFAKCFPEVYNTDPLYVSHYERTFFHQYHSFPSSVKSFQYVAMLGDEMVGYYGVLPYTYLINGQLVQSGMVGGVMTSPNYRKMGIFVKLGNFASHHQKLSGASFNHTFPIRKAVMPGFIKKGWDIIFELPLYIRFLKLNALLKSKNLSLLMPLLNPIIHLYNFLLKRKDNADFEVKVFNKTEHMIGYDDFINKYYKSVSNTLMKDRAFIQWRYGTPGKEYFFFCAYKGDSLMGLVSVCSIVREGVPSYGIVDFMVVDKKCLPNLHNAVFTQAKISQKEAVMMMMSKTSARKYKLTKNAYLKSPFKFNLIFKNLNQQFSKEELSNEDNWHLMFVDSDDL